MSLSTISLDTETTGLDLNHSCRPFMVTMGSEGGSRSWFEWDVDPETRQPIIPEEDVEHLREVIRSSDEIVMHNAKFDVQVLGTIGLEVPWDKVRDTLTASHLLASNQPHDLTSLVLHYLGHDIEPLEKSLKEACMAARRHAKSRYPGWKVAVANDPETPSNPKGSWHSEMWLPRTVARTEKRPESDPWWSVTTDYALADSDWTLPLWRILRKQIEARGLWKIYEERMRVLHVAHRMERRGVTVSSARAGELRTKFQADVERASGECLRIANERGVDLVLPKSGSNGSLSGFVFGELGLPPVKYGEKSGAPSLDQETLDRWDHELAEGSESSKFVRALKDRRKGSTVLQYLDGYARFWVPKDGNGTMVLFPRLNPTGTGTLRFSSSNPNEQNIGRQEGFNIRYAFGPAPGREWWSFDYENIELRIPSFKSGEEAAIAVFERPNDPPYYGSYHLLVASVLHPREFEQHGKAFKTEFESTLYRWIKFGNFAIIYGAQEETADRAYRVRGAYKTIQSRFPRIAELSRKQAALANRTGCIETVPDSKVDPDKGYPLMCARTAQGRVSPTVPLNYYVQGTAMWLTARAMVEVQDYLDGLNRRILERLRERLGGFIVMQIHDELVVDLPARGREGNLPIAREVARIMEECGKGIGVPTPVSATYHPVHWGDGEKVPEIKADQTKNPPKAVAVGGIGVSKIGPGIRLGRTADHRTRS